MLKRKIALLALAASTMLALSSCNLSEFLNINTTTEEESLLDYDISDADISKVRTQMDKLDEILERLKTSDMTIMDQININSYFSNIINQITNIASARNKEYVKYALDKSIGTTQYLYLQEVFTEIYTWYKSFLTDACEVSSLKYYLFGDKTDEEIEKIIGKTYSDKYYELENEISELETQYNALSSSDSNFQDQAEAIYVQIISKAKELATEAGFSSYLEYKYDSFNRDYTKEDSCNFASYVSEYIIPELYNNQYSAKDLKATLSEEEQNQFISFFSSTDETSYSSYFDSYIKTFDDTLIKSSYSNFKSTNAFYAETTNSIEGAFTTYIIDANTAVCYFGTSYQNIFTRVHEFGHMNAMTYQLKNDKTASLDVSETQSQGNEMLFLSYLIKNKGDLSDNLLNAVKKYRLRDSLTIILLATIMDQFEQKVFDNANNYTADELDQVMIDTCEEMGGYEKIKMVLGGADPVEYYHRAIIDSQFYYISYATSLIPSISLYEEGLSDYSNAQDIYETIYKFDSDNYEFKSGMIEAGLSNPFEEDAFQQLTNLLA